MTDNFLGVVDNKPIDMSDEEWAAFERNMRLLFASMQRENEAYVMSLSLRDAILFTAESKGNA